LPPPAGAIAAHLAKYGLKLSAITLEEEAKEGNLLQAPQGCTEPGGLLWAWFCAGTAPAPLLRVLHKAARCAGGSRHVVGMWVRRSTRMCKSRR
jgi:hypothetical protein